MPKLVRLYIRHIAIGFILSAAFVATLIGLNVANLRHLILGSDMAAIALAMMWIFNGIVFSGVQFAIAIMSMGQDDRPRGPTMPAPRKQPVPVVIPVSQDRR